MLKKESFKNSMVQKVIKMDKNHKSKKCAMGSRVQILRVLIQRYYAEKREILDEMTFQKNCEAVLDNTLAKYNYDLEEIIAKWRQVVPKLKEYPIICKVCGYRPVFCLCS